MKSIFSPFSIIFVLILFYSELLQAQSIAKQLPEPKFYILGISDKSFPKYSGSWEDSLTLQTYSIKVMQWISLHSDLVQKLKLQKTAQVMIDHIFFKSLNIDERAVFKSVSKQMSYVLKPQKLKMLSDFEKVNTKTKDAKKDFYKDAEQVYFLHQEDLLLLKRKIKS